MTAPLLEFDDLHVTFTTRRGTVHAVNGVSFGVAPGEVVGVVGESGCGKSVTCLAAMGLLGRHATVPRGRVLYRGEDVTAADDATLRGWRGDRLSMIFQDPMTALNPYLTIATQLTEVLRVHRGASRREALDRSIGMLEACGIPDAARRIRCHPHEFSGGMRQRVMIAMALLLDPDVLFADEPTTALDVTTQSQVLDLLADLQGRTGAAIVFVTHDIGVVARVAQRMIVLYAGRVVEEGAVSDVLRAPAHPYTRGLLASLPGSVQPGGRLAAIPGMPPSLLEAPRGCAFAPRCELAVDACRAEPPEDLDLGGGHRAWCPVVREAGA